MLTVIAVAILVGLFVLFTNVYTEVLWFNQIGFADVFWTYLLIIDSLTLADLMRSGELASRVIAEP